MFPPFAALICVAFAANLKHFRDYSELNYDAAADMANSRNRYLPHQRRPARIE